MSLLLSPCRDGALFEAVTAHLRPNPHASPPSLEDKRCTRMNSPVFERTYFPTRKRWRASCGPADASQGRASDRGKRNDDPTHGYEKLADPA